MKNVVTVALVGDFEGSVPAHQAIPGALEAAGRALQLEVRHQWAPTDEIADVSAMCGFDGIWCVPASPYRNDDGALLAIRHARESRIPFLGTCAGFQYAIVEYARNVLGWSDADHAETSPGAARPVIAPLACALVETTDAVRLVPGSRIATAYGALQVSETYRCRYGLNPRFQAALLGGPLHASADDRTGEIRAIELDDHPFFVATLFQPERAALQGASARLVEAFVRACAG
jgi:CTP synthase (UTP-ammonia lyase)